VHVKRECLKYSPCHWRTLCSHVDRELVAVVIAIEVEQ
jgi:hypothetical protein